MGKKKVKKQASRSSVYIPADLRQRMDKAGDDVNWSSVACAAFEKKLGEIAAQKKEKVMSDVVERLRSSKHESDTEVYRYGFDYGKAWATHDAEARELKNLDDFWDSLGSRWNWWFSEEQGSGDSHDLAMKILGSEGSNRADVQEFWEGIQNTEHPDLDAKLTLAPSYIDGPLPLTDKSFLEGFAKGALNVWHKVKSQI